MESLIAGHIKDSLYRSGLTLDSIRISRIDTITEKDLVSRQTRYHDIRMRRMEELANMQLSHQFLSFSKYKFFVRTGDTTNASRIQMEMAQQTSSASRFSDSAQLYKHILDSLSSLVTVARSRINYYQVFYTQFVAGSDQSRRKDNLSSVILPDYTIKNVEPTRDLVRNPR